MSLFRAIMGSSRIWEGLKSLGLTLALALYIAGSTGYGLLHQHPSAVTHSTEEENDPCHKAIYHVEEEAACKHEAHISKYENCCDCHLLFHSDQIIFRTLLTQRGGPQVFIKSALILPHPEEIALYHLSRGPPRG